MELEESRLKLLGQLPLLLNSSLQLERVMQVAIREFANALNAEATTLFILDPDAESITFWFSEGEQGEALKDRKMPAQRGIVGWVIQHQESVCTNSVQSDPRFFSDVDKTTGFGTKSILCVPLTSRGSRKIGAIQALNCRAPEGFGGTDVLFAEQFSHHVSLAMENATLVEELKLERARLETLERRKNEMMTVITHEIRTPLTLIGTAAGAIIGGGIPPETVFKMHGILQKGLDRLSKLVSELRNLSLLSKDDIILESTTFDIAELVGDEALALKPIIEGRALSLSQELPIGQYRVRGDEGLIRIVVRNLLSNAIRFTPNGGTISLKVSSELGLAHISVTDTGIGIAPEELPLIFQKFYEVGQAIHHSSGDFAFRSGGLGIGLSTAQAILTAHSSALSAQSVLGKGSTFCFSMPIAN